MAPRIDEMRTQIQGTSMPFPAERSRSQRRSRVGLLSGAVLASAAAIGAAVIFLSANSGAPPAYAAVVQVHNGVRTVKISLRQVQDMPQLNARLAAEHTNIRVVPVVRGCDAPVHQLSDGKLLPGPAETLLAAPQYFRGRQLRESDLDIVEPVVGGTLVIADFANGLDNGSGDAVVPGSVPACFGIGPRQNIPG